MKSSPMCPLVRHGLLLASFFFSSLVSASATELLVRWSEGGPHQYTGLFGPVAIGFTLDEPTRIEAIQTWINSNGPVKASLLSESLSYELYSKTFTSTPPPGTPPGTLSIPAIWQGVGSLHWDLAAGDYYLAFDSGSFPLGYPVIHPNPPGVQTPNDFEYYVDDRWESFGFPVGVRIYGSPLSAIPEPATYGLFGTVFLAGLIAIRCRSFVVKRSG